jgi:acyl-CoA thioester hydrolase
LLDEEYNRIAWKDFKLGGVPEISGEMSGRVREHRAASCRPVGEAGSEGSGIRKERAMREDRRIGSGRGPGSLEEKGSSGAASPSSIGSGWVAKTRLRVRYAETDAMGIAHHSVYYVWFEAARTEFCRELGVPYAEWEARGVFLPVVETRCRHKSSIRYDDEIVLETRVVGLDSHSVTFGYRVLRVEDGRLVAEGSTRHGFCGTDGRLLRGGDNPMRGWLASAMEHPPEKSGGGSREEGPE